ncbi:MAG: M15 family metallopeptidase [bacterium]
MIDIEIIPKHVLLQVKVEDNGESLVDLRNESPEVSFEIAEYLDRVTATGVEFEDAHFVRESVAKKIAQAQEKLPEGYKLLIRCGYRTPAVQSRQYKHDYDALILEHPDWNETELDIEIENRTASVDVAPHCTGGAVDLTIVGSDGKQLDMGTKMGTFGSKTHTCSNQISQVARNNRILLLDVMTGAGFFNFPGEWWHYAYGDRDWAVINNTHSIYGPIEHRA